MLHNHKRKHLPTGLLLLKGRTSFKSFLIERALSGGTMNIIDGEEQRRPSFGLHAFLTKIHSPRRKQRPIRNKIVDNDDDESSRGHYCPYVSSPSSLEMTPRKPHMTSSVCSVSSTSSSTSTKSTQSNRVRKATLRSLFQRNSLKKSQQSKKKNYDDDDDDQISLLLTSLPLEQVNVADDNHSSMSSDWSNSWREDNFERRCDSGDSYESIMPNYETSQSTIDPDISLLFFSSNEDLCETPRRRKQRQATVPRPPQLETKDTESSGELRPSRRTAPPSPRRRRHTRKPARLRVRHAS
ncbi:hypothetical protein FisN_32Lh069 [Fistulifera solaris]|uniref:Uncharacterized protein n=1 Tax=Fistulifera solaris TaxID=1519565 RepID=A0A1Z5JGK9_FISSO|nr:hypothetical protein FisN_32Lh069 [Fistulifera solaris]|eukprot:GAX12908.1 hypothetical protein FisN_32Lh069 [Fistulifera solaris]